MQTTITDISALIVKSCPVCGIRYAVPERFDQKRIEDNATFYCPSGHSLHYHESQLDRARKEAASAKCEAENLRRIRANLEERISEVSQQKARVERSLTATKGAKTRLKNRIMNGVCPCCDRHFSNLHEHMQKQHPDFTPGADDEAVEAAE